VSSGCGDIGALEGRIVGEPVEGGGVGEPVVGRGVGKLVEGRSVGEPVGCTDKKLWGVVGGA
jgi:hypothetical protein